MSFLAGVVFVQQLAELPSWWFAGGLVPVVLAARRWRWLVPICWLCGGIFWASAYAGWNLRHPLPPDLDGVPVTVTGRIVSLPEVEPLFTQFRLRVTRLQDASGTARPLRGAIRLRWYDIELPVEVGETWRLQVKLRRPRGFRNPGGFDYEAWLFQRRIRATGYVLDRDRNAKLSTAPGPHRLTRARGHIRDRFAALLDGHPMTGVLTALGVGVRDAIAPGQWELLRRTGTIHLVAISGLHVSLVSGLVGLVAAWCWRRAGRGPLWWPTAKSAAAAALLAGLAYSALAGFSIPTRRALLMLCTVVVAVWLQRPLRPGRVLGLALLAVLFFDPLAVLAQGFWLSFAAVAVILFVVRGQGARPRSAEHHATQAWAARARGRVAAWGRVQLAVTVGLAPLLLAYYQHLSIVSPLANVLAIPVVGFVCVPLVLIAIAGVLLGIEPLASQCLALAAAVLEVLWGFLSSVGNSELAYWGGVKPPPWAVGAAFVGAAIVLLPRGIPYRWLGAVWLAPLLFARPAIPAPGEAWVTVLDVGQGLSVVVRTRGHALVYDTGARFSEHFDAGSAVVVPYLRTAGVRSVDTLVVSHDDNDHRGGVSAILKAMPVGRRLGSDPSTVPAGEVCWKGQRWRWDGVDFEILWPGENGALSSNDRSCVLRLATTGGVVLLPGDIERSAEAALVDRSPELLRADVLVLAHHGSRTSSTAAFLDAVQPRLAVVSAGYRNRFGHPHPEVMDALRVRNIAHRDTETGGAIDIRLGAAPLEVHSYRPAHARYYHAK